MTIRAAFFDVGDTLVEHWAPRQVVGAKARAQVCAALGELPWLDDLLDAEIEPVLPESYAQQLRRRKPGDPRFEPEGARQDTNQWYASWLRSRGVDPKGLDIDRLRTAMCVALNEISAPVAGAFDALRWCADEGLRVVLVTNTLSRGDVEALDDWRRFGLADVIHGVVSSHGAGWRKPHPAIFERALEIAEAEAAEAFHVGDNLIADVLGAQQVGIRAIWRRSERAVPPSDERGEPPARSLRERAEACTHPSEHLYLARGELRCGRCGEAAGPHIHPDAVIDDLTELQAVVTPWLTAGVA